MLTMPTNAMRAMSAGWITNDAFPGVRAHVTPVPSDEAAFAILSALQRPGADARPLSRSPHVSAWHRAALLEATGSEGDAWDPGT